MLKTRSQYRQNVALIVLLALSVGLYVWRFDSFQVGVYRDDAEYVVLAKSIVLGHGYGLVNSPGAILPTRYPFGWPLVLSPVYAFFGGDFLPLKLLSLLFTLANIVLIVKGWKYLGFGYRSIGLGVSALFALSPTVVGQSGMVMSESAFLFFSLLGLILFVKTEPKPLIGHFLCVATGVIWMFVAYTRTIGFALIAASILYLTLKKQWSKLILAAVGLAVALTVVQVGTGISWKDFSPVGEYGEQFVRPASWGQENVSEGMVPRIGEGLHEYAVKYVPSCLMPFLGGSSFQNFLGKLRLGSSSWLVIAGLWALVVLGYVLSIRAGDILPVHFFVPAYLAITILWPWRGERFLYGILPFLFGFMLLAGLTLLKALKSRVNAINVSPEIVAAGMVAFLLCLQFGQDIRIEDSLKHTRDLRVGTYWIRNNTAEEAVVISEEAQAVSLYANRATLSLPDNIESFKHMLLSGQSTTTPYYLLLAPELKWSDKGELEYSERTGRLLNALQLGALPAQLVFEDSTARVLVYFVKNST